MKTAMLLLTAAQSHTSLYEVVFLLLLTAMHSDLSLIEDKSMLMFDAIVNYFLAIEFNLLQVQIKRPTNRTSVITNQQIYFSFKAC